jgi:tyrosine-protein kinase Etk/Wzc
VLASTQVRGQLEALLQRLGLHAITRDAFSVALSGVDANVGTTTLAVGLGWMLASRHRLPTLVLGADLRSEDADDESGGAVRGLRSVLAGEISISQAIHHSEFDGLDVLPAGTGETRLAGTDFGRVLREIEQTYRTVVVDTAPVLEFPESALIMANVHATVLVAKYQHTSRKRLARAGALIRGSGGSLQGVALNGVEDPLPSWLSARI